MILWFINPFHSPTFYVDKQWPNLPVVQPRTFMVGMVGYGCFKGLLKKCSNIIVFSSLYTERKEFLDDTK
jgi:hypothetical protein